MRNYIYSIKVFFLYLFLICVPVLTKAQTYTWGNVAFGGGGYVSGIITHKTSGDVYCRTDVGGAYRWDTTNSVWIPLLDWNSDNETGYQGVEAIALDPQNANNVYLFVGTSYFNNGKSAILKSTDKGNTFTTIFTGDNSSGQFTAHGNRMGRNNGERLAVDPNNSNILFCGTGKNGLWKSTDAGATWSLAWNGVTTTPNENGICFVVFDPSNVSGGITQTIYLGVSAYASTNVYRSTNGGTTFSALSATLPTTFMPHRAALNGNMLYITYANGSGPGGHWDATLNEPCDNGQVWSFNTSTSTATNITPVTGKPYSGVCVDPANANRVIVSTTNCWNNNQFSNAWGDYVYLSTNGGSTWTQKLSSTSTFNANGMGWITGNAIHWAGSIEFDPLNTAKVRIISGNGLFTCDDINAATTAWKFDSKGIEETVALDAISIPGGNFISAVGDVYGAVYSDIYAYPAQNITPTSICNTGVTYAANNTSKVVRVTDKIYYSTNQGTNWTQSTSINGAYGKVALSADGNTILHSPEYKNSGDPTTTYYSTNNGGTWTSTGVTTIQNAVPVADFVNTNKFYIYDRAGGKLLVSTNKGVSFTASSSNPGTWGSQLIRAVPGNEGHVWVAMYGGLKYTTNNGTSWTTVSNVTYCTAVGMGKTEPSATYPTVYIWGTVGGVTGIFRSIDQGVNWTRINDDAHEWGGPGNGNFVIGDMNVYGRVYMSTVGRGIVVGELSGPQPLTANAGSDVTICQGNSTTLNGSASGGTGTYTYSWSLSTGLSSTSISNPVASPSSTTTYTLTVNDGTSTATDQVAVTVIPATSIPFIEAFDATSGLPTGWATSTTGSTGFSQTGSVMNCNPTTDDKGAWVDTRSSSSGTSDLITPSLSFIGYTNTQLSYDYVMKGYDGPGGNDKFDNLNISVSTCGGAYSSVYSYTPSTMVSGTLSNPATTDCQSNTVNLSAYNGLSGVKIKFSITDNDGNNFYIDNINVTGTSVSLPVTILGFEGSYHKNNSSVKLVWTAVSESDMKGYTLYRSINPAENIWEEVAYVPSLNSGNITESYFYNDTDDLPLASNIYYKLVSLEKNGALYSSKIIAVDTENDYLRAVVYPNPSSHAFNVTIMGAEDFYQLEISDMLGQIVSSMEVSSSGSISLGTDFPSGIYFVNIKGSKEQKVIKVLKD